MFWTEYNDSLAHSVNRMSLGAFRPQRLIYDSWTTMTNMTQELILNNPVGGARINNIEVSASRTDADNVRSIAGPSTVVRSPIS